MTQRGAVQVRTYPAATQAEAYQAFAADAAEAARHGFRPSHQAWDGQQLMVTYQHQAVVPQESAAERGFGMAVGCVAFIVDGS